MGLTKLTVFWFLLSAAVVTIDFSYVIARTYDPENRHPLSKNPVFAQWDYYATFDKRYGARDDAFVMVQSLGNVVEVLLQLVAVVLHFTKAHLTANKVALVVSVMTLYKTVMYGMMEYFENGKYTKHNALPDLLLMVVIPSSFWVLVPGIIIVQSWCRINGGSPSSQRKDAQKKLK